MRIARLIISPDLLADMLHLPSGTRIVGAAHDGLDVSLSVTHEELKHVTLADGKLPPAVRPTFRSHPASSVEFVTWGQTE